MNHLRKISLAKSLMGFKSQRLSRGQSVSKVFRALFVACNRTDTVSHNIEMQNHRNIHIKNQPALKQRLTIALFLALGVSNSAWADSPGGVAADLKVWFKADAGTSSTTDGADVDNWVDQSQLLTISSPVGQKPTFTSNGLNFNAALDFVSGDRLFLDGGVGSNLLGIGNGAVDISLYAVFLPTTDSSNNGDRTVAWVGDAGPEDAYYIEYDSDSSNQTIKYKNYNNNNDGQLVSPRDQVALSVLTYDSTGNAAFGAGGSGYLNGQKDTFGSTGSDVPTFEDEQVAIGSRGGENQGKQFMGQVAEFIAYNNAHDDGNSDPRRKIESYLALKYGITLDVSLEAYLDSAGNQVWGGGVCGDPAVSISNPTTHAFSQTLTTDGGDHLFHYWADAITGGTDPSLGFSIRDSNDVLVYETAGGIDPGTARLLTGELDKSVVVNLPAGTFTVTAWAGGGTSGVGQTFCLTPIDYWNGIAGIANDSGSALNQRVSKSVNADAILTMATDTDFLLPNNTTDASINSGAGRTALADGQFLVVGNNGQPSTSVATMQVPTGNNLRLERIWQAKNTGSVGAVNLKFDGFDNSWSIVAGSSTDFTSATAIALNADGEVSVTLADENFFTLVSFDALVEIGFEGDNPDNVNSDISVTELGTIDPAIAGLVAGNETAYQDYIDANPDSFASPATQAEVQSMVDVVNASQTVLTQIGRNFSRYNRL